MFMTQRTADEYIEETISTDGTHRKSTSWVNLAETEIIANKILEVCDSINLKNKTFFSITEPSGIYGFEIATFYIMFTNIALLAEKYKFPDIVENHVMYLSFAGFKVFLDNGDIGLKFFNTTVDNTNFYYSLKIVPPKGFILNYFGEYRNCRHLDNYLDVYFIARSFKDVQDWCKSKGFTLPNFDKVEQYCITVDKTTGVIKRVKAYRRMSPSSAAFLEEILWDSVD